MDPTPEGGAPAEYGKERSLRRTARVAGLLYLGIVIFGLCAEFLVRSNLVVSGDPAATAHNIIASETLFRFGIVSEFLAHTFYLFAAFALYSLFVSVDRRYASAMVVFVAASLPITLLNMVNQYAALYILTEGSYLSAFGPAQLNALALLSLEMHAVGYKIAGIFFGLWLFPLGYLAYKSDFIPRILGVLLVIGGFGILIDVLVVFLFPNYGVFAYPGLAIATVAEFSFVLWLLIRGVRVRSDDDLAPATDVKGVA